jgi:hypothetical protein
MTDEELVKRLRSMHWCVTTQTNGVGVSDRAIAPEAADRIEELEAKLKGAVAECERIGGLWYAAEAALKEAAQNDGRPCSTDRFLAVILDEIEDHYDMIEAIRDWTEGAWDEAVEETSLALIKENSHD